jgi:uncharacterized glyoxalase superfamily protein PhnB
MGMTTYAKNCKSTVIPGLRYRDAMTMIDWLCGAFGFEKHAIYNRADNTVMHAELRFGNGMIMIGSVDNQSALCANRMQPDELGGKETQAPYLIVSDCDAVYKTAKAAGAKILMDLEEKDYGGKGFSCSDPEGHTWHLGSYDPWEAQAK